MKKYTVRLHVVIEADTPEEARQTLFDDLVINLEYTGPEGSDMRIDNLSEIEETI